MIDDKQILDLGFVAHYECNRRYAYKLPEMRWSSVWLKIDGSCDVSQRLYKTGYVITSSITDVHYNSVSEAIPHIQNIIKQFKEFSIEIKKEKMKEDFCN